MPEKPLSIGEHGRNVAANVERLRQAQRISLRDLSARLAEHGRPILPQVLHRQAQLARRVDVDDLAAFAAVFGVSPADLLAPPGEAPVGEPAPEHAALTAASGLSARLAALVDGGADQRAAAAATRALRRVQIELEELLDTTEGAARA